IDQPPESACLGRGPLCVARNAGVNFDRDATISPTGALKHGPENIACRPHVPGSQESQSFADGSASQREFSNLALIAGSRPDSLGEDRWIGCDTDDLAVIHHFSKTTRFDQRSA